MKQDFYDWLLRLLLVDSAGNRTVTHINFYGMSKEQIKQIASEYGKDYTTVRVFKLEFVF